MNLKPHSDFILIEPVKQEEVTKGGILIPETVREDRPMRGTVVAVGPGKMNDKGERIAITIKVGLVVVFKKYAPDEVKVDDKEYFFIKEDDILAIVD